MLLVWLADLNRLTEIGAASAHAVEALDYLETLFVGIIDAALAAQNAALAAEPRRVSRRLPILRGGSP